MKVATRFFETMGYQVIVSGKGTANGPDLHIVKDNLVLRVEVKKARRCKRSMAVHPVEPARRNDDMVAVEFPSGYVLIEPMKDYLSCCAKNGSRSFFGIY